MKKNLFLFLLVASLALLGAGYRFHDSSHSMGLISRDGGRCRHPAVLDAGRGRSVLIVTAAVLPPYRGNARLALEGAPGMEAAVYGTDPPVPLPLHHRPVFRGNGFEDLRPRDRIAFWVVLKDAVEGTGPADAAVEAEEPPEGSSCCAFGGSPAVGRASGPENRPEGTRPALVMRDSRSGEKLLTIPILFKQKGGTLEDH